MPAAFFGGLRHTPLQLVGGGANPVGGGQDVPLVEGKRYELRCSDVVYVRPGGGSDPRGTDIQVVPAAPLTFRADTNVMRVAAGAASCFAWLREESEQ